MVCQALGRGFDLTVRVSRPDGPPWLVSCEAFSRREDAEVARDACLPPTSSRSAVAAPFDGRPLTVDVPAGCATSPLGRVVRRWQFRHLVVVGVLPDGRRVAARVDIPDDRVSQEVAVVLP